MRTALYLLQKWGFILLSVLVASWLAAGLSALAPGGAGVPGRLDAANILQQRTVVTLELVLYAAVLSWIIGSALGAGMALLRRHSTDFFLRPLPVLLLAAPLVVIAFWLILQFAVRGDLLPVAGRTPVNGASSLTERMAHLVLPVLTMVCFGASAVALFVRRHGLLENEDMVRAILAALPVVTAAMLNSVVLIETIFAYPGLGRMLTTSLLQFDFGVTSAVFTRFVLVGAVLQALLVLPLVVGEAIMRKVDGLTAFPFPWLVGGDELPPRYPPEEPDRDGSSFQAALSNTFTVITVGAVLVLMGVVVISALPGLVTQLDPADVNVTMGFMEPGTEGRPLGTDELGRDVQVRLLYATRTTLSLGFAVALIALVGGAVLGIIAGATDGVAGGLLSLPLNALTTFALTVPILPLLLMNVGVAGVSGAWLGPAGIIGIASVGILFRRMMRARENATVGTWFALVGMVLVLGIAYGAATEVAVSFLGFGVQPPVPSWGNMLTNAQTAFRQAPYLITVPSTVITVTLFALLVIAQRLRDTLPF